MECLTLLIPDDFDLVELEAAFAEAVSHEATAAMQVIGILLEKYAIQIGDDV